MFKPMGILYMTGDQIKEIAKAATSEQLTAFIAEMKAIVPANKGIERMIDFIDVIFRGTLAERQ